ncbi:MAG: thioredoxin family protein [Gammaproteobacteria bacterium]|uniref:Small redox-active disulfide protein 2 n=1 Tax=Tolumonas osonensis TaxID=675874 RepID=A0A841GB00_9GAMM|nr:thioredoxin family protein [Tolumonas osonensis]MBB6056248.1 small redox-active disulfide protein 2 [Tolumonas osonensis]NCB58856.1 thioredoxin family protein [Gammaproteobacteria bacterium]
MKNIKVLGPGCANCRTTAKLIDEVAQECGVEIQLEKVESIKEIVGYGVLSTPGVVIDGKVVHSGGVPAKDKIRQWFTAA